MAPSQTPELQDIIVKNTVNNMQLHSSKDTNDKLTALWMLGGSSTLGRPVPKLPSPNHRPVMLIPANSNNISNVVGTHPRAIMNGRQPSPLLAPPYAATLTACPGLSMPYVRTNSVPLIYASRPGQMTLQASSIPGSMPGTFRLGKYYHNGSGLRRKRRPGQLIRLNKTETKHKDIKRRKSDADVTDGKLIFRYTGLDRVIADNFLARQEQTQHTTNSHSSSNQNEYTSSSSNDSDTYGVNNGGGGTSSKAKLSSRDVVM